MRGMKEVGGWRDWKGVDWTMRVGQRTSAINGFGRFHLLDMAHFVHRISDANEHIHVYVHALSSIAFVRYK